MSLSRELANVRVFDAHMHIIDKRFPLVENNGYLPDEFTAKDYLAACGTFDLVGGAVVSGSFQAFDQGYLVAALKELGDGFVGVTQVPATVSDQEILDLAAAGVRAVRFNVKRGGSEELSQLEGLAERVYDLAGWHVEFYIDAAILDPLKERLVRLPAASIDHLGLSQAGFKTLLWLAEQGVRVKATGFGRVDLDVRQALKDLHQANPSALMFGTDRPSTRAPRPYSDADLLLVLDALEENADLVLYRNAQEFYRCG